MANRQPQEKPSRKTTSRPRHPLIQNQEPARVFGRVGQETPPGILFLQQTVGNRAVGGLLAGRKRPGPAASEPVHAFPALQRQEEAAAVAPNYPGQMLRFGSHSEAVRTAQAMLNQHGFGLVVDGIFGPLTHQAVIAFQRAKGLAVDGIIGPVTWSVLAEGSGDGTGTQTPPGEQPAGLSQADLQALAATLTAVGSDLLAQEPLAGMQITPFLQAAAEQLLAGPSPVGERAAQPDTAHSINTPTVMRQMAPDSASTAPKLSDPARLQALQEVKRLFARILDLVVNDLGQKTIVGPAGGPGDPVRTQVLSLEYLHRYFSQLIAQPWPQAQDPITNQGRQEIELFLHRTAALRGFYNSILPPGAALPGEATTPGHMPAQKRPADPRRLQIAGNGLADLGKVKAAEEDSDKRRIGYQHLQSIFDTAWPTHVADGVPNSLIEKKKTGKKLKHGGDKDNPADYTVGDLLPSWCGVGATYWAKKADTSFPDWVMGIGVVNQLQKRTKRELPEVGDMVASISFGHHGIITWVDPAATAPKTDSEWSQISIKTVEANIRGNIVETPTDPTDHSKLAYWSVGVYKPFQ